VSHLSALAIDELVAGDRNDEAAAHVASCSVCAAKVDAARATAEAVRHAPAFLTTREKLTSAERSPRRLTRLLLVAVPLAAALAFIVTRGATDDVRLKGAPLLEVSSAQGVVTRSKPGDRVSLVVGGAGHSHALIFAVDEHGVVDLLWPTGAVAAAISAGARVTLEPAFVVTPGTLRLVAFFSDTAQPVAPVHEALVTVAHDAPVDFTPPAGFGVTASTLLQVEPR
jgi:hypothetical protein